jgi:hypothetical protein
VPNKDEHLKKAQLDETFVGSLDISKPGHLDWAITALFYAGLHYVEAYFATRKVHSPDHRTRDSSIRRDVSIRQIYKDYNELKNFSINARYYMYPFGAADLASLQPRLEKIKQVIAPYLR